MVVSTEEYSELQNNVVMLAELACKDNAIWDIISSSCSLNGERIKLLQKIMLGIQHGKREEVFGQIYQYGSMLREQDLLARQIFLWLSIMIERNELFENT